jgi:Mg2+ and Co2+ transporter CorA
MLASSDNAVMKSVTLLTMIFLPATFVSVSTTDLLASCLCY